MDLIGRKDALALAGLGAGLAGASPWLAGNPMTLPMLMGPMAGAGWLAWKNAEQWLNRVDTSNREGFILPSDEAYDETIGEEGLRLGFTKDNGLPIDIPNNLQMRHTAIIGTSGVGKTTLGYYMLWQQAIRGGGWIFIDAKLDEATRNLLGYMMKLLGREDDFYVLNINDPSNSNTYNPILKGDADEVASRLLNLLPSAENNPGADYYRQTANHALTVLAGALKAAKLRYHFGDMAILLQSGQALSALERMVPPGPEKMQLQVFLDQFRKRTKEGVIVDTDKLKQLLGGMSGRLAFFAQGKFGQVFNTYAPEIDLTDIVLGNKFLYVMLPTMAKDAAALNLGKMILSDLRTAVANVQAVKKRLRPWPPFQIFADEMGSYVMSGVRTLFEQARSAQICMVPAFQTFANLALVSPDFMDTIIGNTWNKVFFKFSSKESSEMAAEILGKMKRYQHSLSVSENQGSSAQALRVAPQSSQSDSGGIGESWREAEEFRVTPDQLKGLGMGEAVVLSGTRMFHINTPMLDFPADAETTEYRVVRHSATVPRDEKVLDFEQRYREFLVGGGISPEAPAAPNTARDLPDEAAKLMEGLDHPIV